VTAPLDRYARFWLRVQGEIEPAMIDWIRRTWDTAKAIVTDDAVAHLADDKGGASLAYDGATPTIDPAAIGGRSVWLPERAAPPPGWARTGGIWIYERALIAVPAAPEETRGTIATMRFGELGWIDNLVVPEELRRQGIGDRLVAGALRAFAADGLARAGLFVAEDNAPAIRLYERLGFRLARRWNVFSAV
jgi:ribosomal protein S18 acetylase RimI-like enzyme